MGHAMTYACCDVVWRRRGLQRGGNGSESSSHVVLRGAKRGGARTNTRLISRSPSQLGRARWVEQTRFRQIARKKSPKKKKAEI